MKKDLAERAKLVATFFKDSNGTIRGVAKEFNISKSTAHLDLTKRLKKIDKNLYKQIKKMLEKNFEEKHLRGGESTRKKYLKK